MSCLNLASFSSSKGFVKISEIFSLVGVLPIQGAMFSHAHVKDKAAVRFMYASAWEMPVPITLSLAELSPLYFSSRALFKSL